MLNISSFDQPGTYVVTFHAKDRAGHETTAQKTMTVKFKAAGAGWSAAGTAKVAFQKARRN